MGSYYKLFYGEARDSSLLLNHPQPIRSDEWLVNTQMTIAQSNDNYNRVNKNIGDGEDVSVVGEAPYKEWSAIFKPQNLAFFVLPFENAFALRWWLMAYLLILSCYFFILALLPAKKLFAAFLSIALLLSPFVQWWYLYGTLGCIYFSLFGGLILMKLLNQKRLFQSLLWGLLLTYIAVCFALILYPPFQIPCALAMLAFVAGYSFEKLKTLPRREVMQKMGILLGSAIFASLLVLVFLNTRADVVSTIQNTAYPGKRIQKSGEYDVIHLFSSHLSAQLQFGSKANHYLISGAATNQSEASNFLLLLPFLLLPSIFVLYKYYKKDKQIDWPLLLTNCAFLLIVIWLSVPNIRILGKLTLLEAVPHTRLIIGLGVLNIVQNALFVRRYTSFKTFIVKWKWALIYVSLVFVIELGLGLYVMHHSPGFIGIRRVIAFALPVPVILYLLLRKHFNLAASGLLAFSIVLTFRINPLYHGTSILTKTPVSLAIQRVASQDDGVWATEHFLLENFVFMNGARSLSGVYSYPQLELWRDADPGAPDYIYNRYAHTIFAFDRDHAQTIPTKVSLTGGDSLGITTEPCSEFLRKHNTRYLLTAAELNPEDKCASLIEQINYPAITFFIYKLNH